MHKLYYVVELLQKDDYSHRTLLVTEDKLAGVVANLDSNFQIINITGIGEATTECEDYFKKVPGLEKG